MSVKGRDVLNYYKVRKRVEGAGVDRSHFTKESGKIFKDCCISNTINMGKLIHLENERIVNFGKTQIRSAKKININVNSEWAKIQCVKGDTKMCV